MSLVKCENYKPCWIVLCDCHIRLYECVY